MTGHSSRRWLTALAWLLTATVLFVCYLHISRSEPANSDGAANALQAWDMLHGNLLLHNWWLSDVSFYTTELPEYMLVELARGAERRRRARGRGPHLHAAGPAGRGAGQGPRLRPRGRRPDAAGRRELHRPAHQAERAAGVPSDRQRGEHVRQAGQVYLVGPYRVLAWHKNLLPELG